MKKNKKLNSIATMSKEELQEVNGGMSLMGMYLKYPKRWIDGVPAEFYNSNQELVYQGLLEKNAVMKIGI